MFEFLGFPKKYENLLQITFIKAHTYKFRKYNSCKIYDKTIVFQDMGIVAIEKKYKSGVIFKKIYINEKLTREFKLRRDHFYGKMIDYKEDGSILATKIYNKEGVVIGGNYRILNN
jgi:hypothetical protein